MTRDEREELSKARPTIREERGGPPLGLGTIVVGAVAGIALVYFLDPDAGRRRRAMLGDRLGAFGRRGRRAAGRARRYAGSTIEGTRDRIAAGAGDDEPVDDRTLTDRVESQVFRDQDLPKGELNIDTVGGVVMIRGEVDRPDVMNEIVARTWRVEGVKDVRNLMHLPGTPAPHID